MAAGGHHGVVAGRHPRFVEGSWAAVSSPPGHIWFTGAPNILAGRKFFFCAEICPWQ